MKYSNARILVFAKAPLAGYAKTRLVPALGETAAARLQQALITRTLEIAVAANLCPVELWCAPDIKHEFFSHCQATYNITLHQQQGHNLGQRMTHALADALMRSRHVILIGTDNADLDGAYLRKGIEALSGSADVVIGPARDGGYVLIGLNKILPALFSNISWSSSQVLTETRQQLAQLAASWHELETCRDIDRPEDLRYLPAPLNSVFTI